MVASLRYSHPSPEPLPQPLKWSPYMHSHCSSICPPQSCESSLPLCAENKGKNLQHFHEALHILVPLNLFSLQEISPHSLCFFRCDSFIRFQNLCTCSTLYGRFAPFSPFTHPLDFFRYYLLGKVFPDTLGLARQHPCHFICTQAPYASSVEHSILLTIWLVLAIPRGYNLHQAPDCALYSLLAHTGRAE